jgi:hypothetical protein
LKTLAEYIEPYVEEIVKRRYAMLSNKAKAARSLDITRAKLDKYLAMKSKEGDHIE